VAPTPDQVRGRLFFLPRHAAEEKGGGLNGLNGLNVLNPIHHLYPWPHSAIMAKEAHGRKHQNPVRISSDKVIQSRFECYDGTVV
jgi:hypothetical protein